MKEDASSTESEEDEEVIDDADDDGSWMIDNPHGWGPGPFCADALIYDRREEMWW